MPETGAITFYEKTGQGWKEFVAVMLVPEGGEPARLGAFLSFFLQVWNNKRGRDLATQCLVRLKQAFEDGDFSDVQLVPRCTPSDWVYNVVVSDSDFSVEVVVDSFAKDVSHTDVYAGPLDDFHTFADTYLHDSPTAPSPLDEE